MATSVFRAVVLTVAGILLAGPLAAADPAPDLPLPVVRWHRMTLETLAPEFAARGMVLRYPAPLRFRRITLVAGPGATAAALADAVRAAGLDAGWHGRALVVRGRLPGPARNALAARLRTATGQALREAVWEAAISGDDRLLPDLAGLLGRHGTLLDMQLMRVLDGAWPVLERVADPSALAEALRSASGAEPALWRGRRLATLAWRCADLDPAAIEVALPAADPAGRSELLRRALVLRSASAAAWCAAWLPTADPEGVAEVCDLLAGSGDSRAGAILRHHQAKDRRGAVREAALMAMAVLPPDPERDAWLLREFRSGDRQRRRVAMRVLARRNGSGDVSAILAEAARDPDAQEAALDALIEHDLPGWDRLDPEKAWSRWDTGIAASLARSARPEAAPWFARRVLIAAAREPDRPEQAMWLIQYRVVYAWPWLADAWAEVEAKADPPWIRWWAGHRRAVQLGQVPDYGPLLEGPNQPMLVRWILTEDAKSGVPEAIALVRSLAADLLPDAPDGPSHPALVGFDRGERPGATELLGVLGRSGDPADRDLLVRLARESPWRHVRDRAARAIADRADPADLSLVLGWIDDEDPALRGAAIHALRNLDAPHARTGLLAWIAQAPRREVDNQDRILRTEPGTGPIKESYGPAEELFGLGLQTRDAELVQAVLARLLPEDAERIPWPAARAIQEMIDQRLCGAAPRAWIVTLGRAGRDRSGRLGNDAALFLQQAVAAGAFPDPSPAEAEILAEAAAAKPKWAINGPVGLGVDH